MRRAQFAMDRVGTRGCFILCVYNDLGRHTAELIGDVPMYVYFYEPLRSTIIVARGISAGRRRRK
jgi:hypothetical protein